MAKFAFWAILLVAPLPFLVLIWTRLIAIEHYRLFALLWIALPALITMRWDRALRLPNDYLSRTMIGCGAIALVFGLIRFSPWMGSIAWVLFMGAFLHSQREQALKQKGAKRSTSGKSLLHLWPLALLLIPLPKNLDQTLIAWVNETSLAVGSFVLDGQGIPNRTYKGFVELGSAKLNLEQHFGGTFSLFALILIASFVVVLQRRTFWHFPFYFLAAILWAIPMNALRAVFVVNMQSSGGWDWTSGWQQSLLAIVTLAIATLFLFSSDRLFQVLFYPIKTDELADKPNPLLSVWNKANGY